MFVTSPMMATSPWATKPVTPARTIDHPQMINVRPSISDRSAGTRADSIAGAIDGATGIPSAVAPRSRSWSLVFSVGGGGVVIVLEDHRRVFLSAHGVENLGEGIGESFLFGGKQAFERFEQPLLRDGGRALERRASGAREIEHETAGVVAGAIARDESPPHPSRGERRGPGPVGGGALRPIAPRQRRRFC